MHHYRQFAKLYAPTPRSGSRRYWRGRSLPRCVRLFSSRTYPKTIARRIGSRGEPVAFLLDSTTGLDVRLIVIKAASLGYCRGLCAGSPYSSDRKSVVEGKSGPVRVVIGGRRTIKKKKTTEKERYIN